MFGVGILVMIWCVYYYIVYGIGKFLFKGWEFEIFFRGNVLMMCNRMGYFVGFYYCLDLDFG